MWKASKDREKLNIVAKGGRGSGKSSDISIIITQLIMRRVQMSNREFAKELWKRGYQSDEIYCDSAEPKSIDEMKKEHGIKRVKGVKKDRIVENMANNGYLI